jgi:flavin-dependent dehydrogenase
VFTRDDDSARFDFAQSARPLWRHAWEVPRDVFDVRLRAAAAEAGVRFIEARATRFEDGVLATDRGPISCGFFVDAAGRRKFLARQLGEVVNHPVLRNAAQHARYRGVQSLAPEQPGDIVISRFDGGWFWFIPFADGTTSVGMVTELADGPSGDRWAAGLARCPQAQLRLRGAEPTTALSGVQNFTSYASRFHGPGWAMTGDAALFLDPVFSSGVLVALETSWSLGEVLRDGGDLAEWEAAIRRDIGPMEKAVMAFYDGAFLDVAFAPAEAHKDRYRKQITSLLAGDLFVPGNDVSRRMADKLPWLAGLASQLATGSDRASGEAQLPSHPDP